MNIQETIQKIVSSHLSNGPIPVSVRKTKLQELSKEILLQENEISKALKEDLGKSDFESYVSEIGFILDELRYTTKHLDKWVRVKKVSTPINLFPGKSYIKPEPYGVVLIIAPWNYPFQLCLSPLIGALAAGNRIVLKPSEFTSHTSRVIRLILEKTFTDNEVVVIEGDATKTEELLKQKFDYIFFTGSTSVGRIVMQAAARHLTPVTLELGGKSPCLIERSANIELAAKRCVWGKFFNAGQTCVAPDYVLVPTELQDHFISCANSYIRSFYGEDIMNSQDYSRIINQKNLDRLNGLILKEKLVIGGQGDKENRFFPPTLMKDVTWSDKVMEDEIFGPILPVIPYVDLHETLEKLNSLSKPLAFYLFTGSDKMKDQILSRVSFGGGCVNDTIVHLSNPGLPFGGVGASGMGAYHGQKSFETFTHFKSIFEQSSKVDIPLRYPPYGKKLKWIKYLLG